MHSYLGHIEGGESSKCLGKNIIIYFIPKITTKQAIVICQMRNTESSKKSILTKKSKEHPKPISKQLWYNLQTKRTIKEQVQVLTFRPLCKSRILPRLSSSFTRNSSLLSFRFVFCFATSQSSFYILKRFWCDSLCISLEQLMRLPIHTTQPNQTTLSMNFTNQTKTKDQSFNCRFVHQEPSFCNKHHTIIKGSCYLNQK